MVWNLYAYYSKAQYLSHNTFWKVQTQSSNNKNFSRLEKSKLKDSKLAPSRNNAAEPAKKKDRKNKKKRFRGQRQKHTGKRDDQTQTTNINITEAVEKKKFKIRCFNCDKIGHYIKNCIKPLKNKCWSRQFLCR